ncbi:CPBP family glutamic-type intramembrane protease [Hellea sp.]|nr:CPBP family glutamic-type intramembrane protease [Hellea sp.]
MSACFWRKTGLAGGGGLLWVPMAVIKDMFAFLRSPTLQKARSPLTPDAVLDLIKLLGFCFLTLFVAGLFMAVVFNIGGVTMPEPADEFSEMISVLMAPLIEEILFRSWLGRGWGVMVVAPLLLGLAALIVIAGAEALAPGVKITAVVTVTVALIIYLFRYAALRKIPGVVDRAARKVFPYAFWGSCIAFGLMHLANFQGGDMGLLLPLVVLPQFLIGIILGFTRMRYGLLPAMILHGGYNLSVLTFFTMLSQAAP